MKSLANEFFKTMEEGARAHHAEHAAEYALKVVGIKDETDVAKQIDYVELMIAQGRSCHSRLPRRIPRLWFLSVNVR